MSTEQIRALAELMKCISEENVESALGRDTLNETIDRMYAEDVVYKLFEEQDK